jgi:hypothetical protein
MTQREGRAGVPLRHPSKSESKTASRPVLDLNREKKNSNPGLVNVINIVSPGLFPAR